MIKVDYNSLLLVLNMHWYGVCAQLLSKRRGFHIAPGQNFEFLVCLMHQLHPSWLFLASDVQFLGMIDNPELYILLSPIKIVDPPLHHLRFSQSNQLRYNNPFYPNGAYRPNDQFPCSWPFNINDPFHHNAAFHLYDIDPPNDPFHFYDPFNIKDPFIQISTLHHNELFSRNGLSHPNPPFASSVHFDL